MIAEARSLLPADKPPESRDEGEGFAGAGGPGTRGITANYRRSKPSMVWKIGYKTTWRCRVGGSRCRRTPFRPGSLLTLRLWATSAAHVVDSEANLRICTTGINRGTYCNFCSWVLLRFNIGIIAMPSLCTEFHGHNRCIQFLNDIGEQLDLTFRIGVYMLGSPPPPPEYDNYPHICLSHKT